MTRYTEHNGSLRDRALHIETIVEGKYLDPGADNIADLALEELHFCSNRRDDQIARVVASRILRSTPDGSQPATTEETTVMIYVCNRRRFPTFELASEHANSVFQKRGIIVAIETKPNKRHSSPFSKRDPGFARRAARQFKARDRAAAFA